MFSLTRKVDYALVALTELADHTPARVSARDISTRHQLPLPLLANVLNQLVRAGLIASSRGVRGGYTLARSADRINVVDVIGAIEGAFRLTACCPSPSNDPPTPCDHVDRCRLEDPIRRIHEIIYGVLCQVTLTDLAENRLPLGLESLATLIRQSSS